MGSTARDKGDDLSKEGLVTFDGKVTELLRGGMFRVIIEDNGHELIAQLNGKMRIDLTLVISSNDLTNPNS